MKAEETVVMFIEFQNDFCKEGGKLHDLVREEMARNHTIENALRLLKGARDKGAYILHVPFELDTGRFEENPQDGLLAKLYEMKAFMPNTWGGAIIDEMKPGYNEPILVGKRGLSAASALHFRTLLIDAGIQNIALAGFLTNVCVQATAFSAYDFGYEVRIIPEACCAASQSIQEYVEREVCPIFGGAPTVDEFLAELK